MSEVSFKNSKLVIVVALLATFMVMLDLSLVNISLPTILKDWHLKTSMVMWVLLAYTVSLSAFMLLFGKLGERYGFKIIMSVGFVIFICGTLLSFFSPNIDTLIACRFAQGIGAAMITALAFAAITRFVSPDLRGKGLGIVAAAGSLGTVIGPTLGGYLAGTFGFHTVFLVNIPVGIVALFLSLKVIPGDRLPVKGRFDVIGAVSIFIGIFGIIYALNMGEQLGWTSITIISTILAAVIFIPLFVFWESKRASDPLLNIKAVSSRNVLLPSIGSMMIMAAFAGAFVILPFYFELMHGMTSTQSGQMFLWATVTMVIAGIVAGTIANKVSVRSLSIVSLIIAAAAFFIMSTIVANTGLLIIGLMLLILGIGNGLFYPPSNRMILTSAPPEVQGEASGLLRTMQQVGCAIGVAIFTTIITTYVDFKGYLDGSETLQDLESNFISGMSVCMIIGGIMVIIGVVALLFTRKMASVKKE